MLAVAVADEVRSISYWACGSERARVAKVEVQRPSRDHFLGSFKDSGLRVQKITTNDVRGH